jgi:hypothetical protein
VRKVVLTLTSTSVEIYLSMAGAEQSSDTSFILVLGRVIRPAEVCSRHCIALHCGAYRGELQAWRERSWCRAYSLGTHARKDEDGLLIEFPCNPTRTCTV